jgi:uncharacterized membrane protein (UPF0127 family)
MGILGTLRSGGRAFLHPILKRPGGTAMILNQYTGVPVATTIEAAFDSTTRRKGLLGRDGLAPRHAVVIAPTQAIHTWFMRFAIDVVFASKDGTVVDLRRALQPWRIAVAPRAFCAIELAAGSIERDSIAIGDRLVVTAID